MKFKQNAVALSVALALTSATVSQALPVLSITDGISTTTVSDNQAGDANVNLGAVTFLGSINGWSILVTSGATKPILGSATSPQLDLTWQVTRTSLAGGPTLTISFSENGFNLVPAQSMRTDVGTTLGAQTGPPNSVNVQTFYDLGNNTLATTTALTSHLFTGPGGTSGFDVGGPVGPDSSIAFTVRIVLSQAVGSVTSGDVDLHLVSVPEGGSMVTLLGTGLLTLGVFAARRKGLRS